VWLGQSETERRAVTQTPLLRERGPRME
jgi:hypothetical protein